jgi:hypothetical protein
VKSWLSEFVCALDLESFVAATSTVPLPRWFAEKLRAHQSLAANVPFLLEAVEAQVPEVLKEAGII